MSSKIRVQRICQYCNNEFLAFTTVTRYCSHKCNQRAYKARKRQERIDKSNKGTLKKKNQEVEILQSKEILTVREVAMLLGCSIRTAYSQIEKGNIKATNLGQRLTRVKRSEIDNLFD